MPDIDLTEVLVSDCVSIALLHHLYREKNLHDFRDMMMPHLMNVRPGKTDTDKVATEEKITFLIT